MEALKLLTDQLKLPFKKGLNCQLILNFLMTSSLVILKVH